MKERKVMRERHAMSAKGITLALIVTSFLIGLADALAAAQFEIGKGKYNQPCS